MTQLQRRTETFGGSDQRWLGSREGTGTAQTKTLDYTAWAGKTVNGRIKGGEPVAYNTSTDKWVPYASGGSNGTNKVQGFILNDVPVVAGAGDIVVPLLDRGRIILKYLPSTVAVNATQTGRFLFIEV